MSPFRRSTSLLLLATYLVALLAPAVADILHELDHWLVLSPGGHHSHGHGDSFAGAHGHDHLDWLLVAADESERQSGDESTKVRTLDLHTLVTAVQPVVSHQQRIPFPDLHPLAASPDLGIATPPPQSPFVHS